MKLAEILGMAPVKEPEDKKVEAKAKTEDIPDAAALVTKEEAAQEEAKEKAQSVPTPVDTTGRSQPQGKAKVDVNAIARDLANGDVDGAAKKIVDDYTAKKDSKDMSDEELDAAVAKIAEAGVDEPRASAVNPKEFDIPEFIKSDKSEDDGSDGAFPHQVPGFLNEVLEDEKKRKMSISVDPVKEIDSDIETAAQKRKADKVAKEATINPVLSEEDSKMESRKFYDNIGDLAYESDRNGTVLPALRSYVKTVILRDPALIDEVVKDYLPAIIAKNPGLVPSIEKSIADAANNAIDVKVLFVNTKDSKDTKEYETWADAEASIKPLMETYGVDPSSVFRKIWRKINADGTMGEQLSKKEVIEYIENFRGDKEALKHRLHVKLDDKASDKADKKAWREALKGVHVDDDGNPIEKPKKTVPKTAGKKTTKKADKSATEADSATNNAQNSDPVQS